MAEFIPIFRRRLQSPLFYAGLLLLSLYARYLYLYLYIDFVPQYLLWYSSLGLLLLGVALVTKNELLSSIAFCSLFAIEGFWLINFILAFFDLSIGNKSYSFMPGSPNFDPLGSVYHIFLAPLSLFSILQIKKIYKSAWVYSTLGSFTIGILTYIYASNMEQENINCLFQSCEPLFTSVYQIPNPTRIIVSTILLSLIIFLPSNLVLIYIKNKLKFIE